jgi:hypothetical protein
MIKFGAPSVALMGRDSLSSIFRSASEQPIDLHKVSFKDFEFEPEPGYVYTVSRAISSRVNANYDAWPVDQIKNSYKTFVGRPIYVEHNNSDPERARGVILDAIYKESKLASGVIDASVYCLMEVDAETFPKLANAIMEGSLNAVSMGADVDCTQCSACGKVASKPSEYCTHIPRLKGRTVTVYKQGKRIESLVFESCIRPNFFELSYVFDPADESAWILDKRRY